MNKQEQKAADFLLKKLQLEARIEQIETTLAQILVVIQYIHGISINNIGKKWK